MNLAEKTPATLSVLADDLKNKKISAVALHARQPAGSKPGPSQNVKVCDGLFVSEKGRHVSKMWKTFGFS